MTTYRVVKCLDIELPDDRSEWTHTYADAEAIERACKLWDDDVHNELAKHRSITQVFKPGVTGGICAACDAPRRRVENESTNEEEKEATVS